MRLKTKQQQIMKQKHNLQQIIIRQRVIIQRVKQVMQLQVQLQVQLQIKQRHKKVKQIKQILMEQVQMHRRQIKQKV